MYCHKFSECIYSESFCPSGGVRGRAVECCLLGELAVCSRSGAELQISTSQVDLRLHAQPNRWNAGSGLVNSLRWNTERVVLGKSEIQKEWATYQLFGDCSDHGRENTIVCFKDLWVFGSIFPLLLVCQVFVLRCSQSTQGNSVVEILS